MQWHESRHPIGHVQVKGDYVESWQPQAMSPEALKKTREIAKKVTDNLGGRGIFGVELFARGDQLRFSEGSPRLSAVIYGGMEGKGIAFEGVEQALAVPRGRAKLVASLVKPARG